MGWNKDGRWWEMQRVVAKGNLAKIQKSMEDGDIHVVSQKATLTVENVRDIRQSFWGEGFELYQLASIYQINEAYAMKIVMYETWGAAVLEGELELPSKKVELWYKDEKGEFVPVKPLTDISSRPDPEKP